MHGHVQRTHGWVFRKIRKLRHCARRVRRYIYWLAVRFPVAFCPYYRTRRKHSTPCCLFARPHCWNMQSPWYQREKSRLRSAAMLGRCTAVWPLHYSVRTPKTRSNKQEALKRIWKKFHVRYPLRTYFYNTSTSATYVCISPSSRVTLKDD